MTSRISKTSIRSKHNDDEITTASPQTPAPLSAQKPTSKGTQATPPAASPKDPSPSLLPEVLLRTKNGKEVRHGTDPGDYYCEHAFFAAQQAAIKKDSTILKNTYGERLVGFLHVPGDQWMQSPPDAYKQNDRHTDTQEVVGSAVRGFYDDIASQKPTGPIKILLTGYGTFPGVINNPTGDFVMHQSNLDRTMAIAFGKQLVSKSGRIVANTDNESTYEYRVFDPVTQKERPIQLHVVKMPVDDRAIDGTTDRSIQKTIERFKPQAVISMGVHPSSQVYLAEFHADDGGLRTTGGKLEHDGSARKSINLPNNYALARAINSPIGDTTRLSSLFPKKQFV